MFAWNANRFRLIVFLLLLFWTVEQGQAMNVSYDRVKSWEFTTSRNSMTAEGYFKSITSISRISLQYIFVLDLWSSVTLLHFMHEYTVHSIFVVNTENKDYEYRFLVLSFPHWFDFSFRSRFLNNDGRSQRRSKCKEKKGLDRSKRVASRKRRIRI